MKLLIVEDNAALADNLREIFELEGYEVAVAGTAEAGLAEAERGFDVAIVDVRLPDASGTQVIPKLKACAPNAEALIMTANADLESAIEAVSGGAFAYLTKPVRPEELLLTVARARERVEMRIHAKELTDKLESSERRMRNLVDNVQAVIVRTTADRRVRFISPAVQRILGWPVEMFVGADVAEMLPTADHKTRCLEFLQSLEGTETVEVDCRHMNGSTRRLVWRWTRAREGDSEMFYGIGTDVSKMHELERRAINSEKLAAAGTLTAGLAHEIRNPLNAAGLQLSVLSRMVGRLPDAAQPALLKPIDLVRSELTRLDGLLEDFLAFARPREYQRKEVALTPVVERVATLQREAAKALGRKLTCDIDPGVSILGDANALEQVLINLVANALDACTEHIAIRLKRRETMVELVVVDDGPGIRQHVLDHIFEPFFTTKPTGSGLGMAIAHTIIRAHGGDLDIRSSPGAGTTVTATLPHATATSSAPRAPADRIR